MKLLKPRRVFGISIDRTTVLCYLTKSHIFSSMSSKAYCLFYSVILTLQQSKFGFFVNCRSKHLDFEIII